MEITYDNNEETIQPQTEGQVLLSNTLKFKKELASVLVDMCRFLIEEKKKATSQTSTIDFVNARGYKPGDFHLTEW